MRICILGATGMVGRETLQLVRRAWPDARCDLYASRDQTMSLEDGHELAVRAASALEAQDAPRGDLAFVALDDAHSARFVPRLLELGYRVVDKSNTYRLDPAVPLVVAGVNDHEVTDAVRLVANPNCTSIPLALALRPLARIYGLHSVRVATYQAVSGAGVGPLDEFLGDSQRGYAQPARLGDQFDPMRYAGNTVPHNGGTDASGFSAEERKMMLESRKILGLPQLPMSAQCCRVPVAVGHYENAWITTSAPVAMNELAALYAGHPFVRFVEDPAGVGLSAQHAVRDRDRALVGRARLDPADPSGATLCLTVAADNLRMGAATNAVRIASSWFGSADPALASRAHRAREPSA